MNRKERFGVREILGDDFPVHLCKRGKEIPSADFDRRIEILLDCKPAKLIVKKFFAEPRLIREGEKPKTAKELMTEHGTPIYYKIKDTGIEAIYGGFPVKYCPFCGEKLFYKSKKKYQNKLIPRYKEPTVVITHKIKDFLKLKEDYKKINSIVYSINGKKHKLDDVDFILYLEGLPKIPDYDDYCIVSWIFSRCNASLLYLPRSWNVCVINNNNSYWIKDICPTFMYRADRRYVKFRKPTEVKEY